MTRFPGWETAMNTSFALKLTGAALAAALLVGASLTVAQQPGTALPAASGTRLQGPCDIYEAAKTP